MSKFLIIINGMRELLKNDVNVCKYCL